LITPLAIFVVFCLSATFVLADRKCSRPAKGETTHYGGDQLVVVVDDKPYKTFYGAVADPAEAVKGAGVEVFDHGEYLLLTSPESKKDLPNKRDLPPAKQRPMEAFASENYLPANTKYARALARAGTSRRCSSSLIPKKDNEKR